MARDDAGELNRRITFQRFVGTADIVGDFQYLEDENWKEIFTVWGSCRSIGSREFMAAGQAQMEITHNLKVRRREWPEDPRNMRAVILGRRYRIASPPIDADSERRFQLLKAVEVWP